jgi:catecholate siderophore receptor
MAGDTIRAGSPQHARRSHWLLNVFAATLVASGLHAEPVAVHGKVIDATGSPIRSARIAVVSSAGAAGPSTLSDASGSFVLTLDPGVYTVSVQADGFVEASKTWSVPQDGDAREFVLAVAGIRQAITVTDASDYRVAAVTSGTRTLTPLRDVPQSIAVVSRELMQDQLMMSLADVVRYLPGITIHQGENNRDQVVIRGNSSSADFFLNGVRDDVQYYRDLYNLEQVEALKGPNALIFGRGGGGGVINRVTKEAGYMPLYQLTVDGGSFGDKRVAADWDQPFNSRFAFRLNGMYEHSGGFRDFVALERHGISPTVTFMTGPRTKITIGYETFRDGRVADRGIPSYQGLPAGVPITTYFGDPNNSRVTALVNLGTAAVEHQFGQFNLRSHFMVGDYDRGYQNFVPGAVTVDQTQVALSAYNNATRRRNVFDQTDGTYAFSTGPIGHALTGGVEAGLQLTDNYRNTGYFNNAVTSILVPYADPTIATPVTFRQSATDADNHLHTDLGAAYLQDQLKLSRQFEVISGLRFDYFDLQYHDNRAGTNLRRIDHLISPREGIVFKPAALLSVYGSYSVSYLPSSGDQFSSLTVVTQQVKPEKFTNYEAGIKWDIRREFSLTTAVYRLDRTNTRATDPNDPTRIVQTGSQRTNGFELGVNGSVTRAWSVAGGYAYQDAFITSTTTAALAGAQVALVPHHTFSLWNHYRFRPKWSAGLGVSNRTDMFAAVDITVTLPGYTRVDAALYYSPTQKVRVQANAENLFNRNYYLTADGNNNISPGSSRAVRLAITTRF